MSTPPGLLDLTPLFASNAELDDLTLMPPDTVVPSTHEGQQEPSKQFAMGQPKIMGPEKMTQNGDASKEFEQPETQTQFTPLQEIEASSREEWLTLAQRLKAEERWGEAIAAYKQAVNEDRQPQTQKQSGQDSLKQEIAASPQSFEQLQAQAFTYGQQRQWQACIETCEQALRLQPTASLYKLLGDVSQITGQLTQAQRSYREALRLQPDFAEVYGNLGTLYAREREWQRAIECFRRALRYQPQRAAHHRALAGVWEQVGNEVEAVRCWHQVLSLEPESGQAQDYFSLGNRWVRLGEWPMAERYYREAIARDEQLTDAWHNLAEVLAYHQQWQPAREIYERILPREPQRVMSRLGYARVLTKLQDWQGAMAEYHRLAESAPEQVLAQQRFAQTLKEQGLLEEAIAVYRRALNFAPDGFELRLGFAELLSEQEQWEEALPQAEAAIALNPEVAQAHYYAGRAQVACEQWQAAIPHLEQAVRLDSQLFWARYFWGESLLALEDWQGAAAVLEAAMPLNPEYPGGYCHLGQAFLELERYSEAVQAYRQAISFGSNYLSYSLLGVALLKLKDSDGAIEVLNRGLELTPDYYKFYLLLGEAFLEKQDWQAAIEALGQAVALKPEGLEFNLQLQQLLCRLGQSQEPVKNLRQALDLNCDDPQLQLALGVVLLEGRIDLDWAEACLRQNLELQPNQPQGHFYLGKCSARQGQLDEALGFYRRSWELSQSVDCGLALGEVLQQLGRWSEAVQQYRQVLLEFGESGEALFGLGQALAASERPMEAVVEWRRAMGLGWNSPELYRCLAEALVSLERWDEAVLEWGRLLELQPGNALVRRQRALALIGLGRWSESAQEWQQYWQVAPGSGQGTVLDFRPELGIYGEIPHHQELSLTGDLTIEFWLYLRQWPKGWTDLISKKDSIERNEFCFLLKSGQVGKWYYGNGEGLESPVRFVPQQNIRLNEWNHIACVRKLGQYGRIYVNGQLEAESDGSRQLPPVQTNCAVRLMGIPPANKFQDGRLSEVRLWQVVRTGNEIRAGMCQPLTEIEPGLVTVWSGSDDGILVDAVGGHQGQMKKASATGKPRPRVGVCSCEWSQEAAEKAYTLAELYRGFTQVELIGCLFPEYRGQVWQPIRGTKIPCHGIRVEDEGRFVDQALALVLSHPYEVVHLSNPRMPNIILGLLYKLLWDARIIVDINDEELTLIKGDKSLDLEELLKSGNQLPPLVDLLGQEWTAIAVVLAKAFDRLRELKSTSIAPSSTEEVLAALITEILGVHKFGFSDGLEWLLLKLPAVHLFKLELGDKGKCKIFFDSIIANKKNVKHIPISDNYLRLINWEPEDLVERLWGGYSRYALPALESIKHNAVAPKKDRIQAAWGLCRWYYAKGSYHKSYENIELINVLIVRTNPVYLIAEIQCLMKLNRIDEAKKRLDFAMTLEDKKSSFLILQANVKRNIALRDGHEFESKILPLFYLNKIYRMEGLSPLVLKNPYLPLSLSNITAQAEAKIKDQKLKVSVIMPAYNAAETIKIAIDSLLVQTWKNIEIIVIDDFSSDNTCEVVGRYVERDNRVKLIAKKVNEGCYPTRNRGLASATGDLIIVNDSDDWSHPQKIEYQIDAMRRYNCVAVMSYFVRVNNDFTHFGNWRPGYILNLNHSSLMFKKDIIDKLGDWDNVRVGGDSEFVSRIENFYGSRSVYKMKEELILSLVMSSQNSLTTTESTHVRTLSFGLRWHYRDAYTYWHSHENFQSSPQLSGESRKFPVPLGNSASRLETSSYDLIVVSDFAENKIKYLLVENYIIAACKSGMKVGAIHWRKYDLKSSQSLRSSFYDACHQYGVDILTVGDKVDTKIVLVAYSSLFQYKPDNFPSINTTNLLVIVNQLAANYTNNSGFRYDPYIVRANLRSLFGKEGCWIPGSLGIKQWMSKDKSYPDPHQNPWYPTFNVEQFWSQNLRCRSKKRKKPVIGCCVQGSYLQWLGELTGLNQVDETEDSPSEVRVLWHNIITDWNPEKPVACKLIDADIVSIHDFLKDLDFFINYPHEDNIDEFIYEIFESMAVGIPVILPNKYGFPDIFGKAALYASTEDVHSRINDLWLDETKYMQQAEIARHFVENNCSFRLFVDRLNNLKDQSK